MDSPVAGDDYPAEKVEVVARIVRDRAACLLQQQHSRSDVPRRDAAFPISVVATAGDVGDVQRRSAGTSYRLAEVDEAREIRHVLGTVLDVVQKAGGQQRLDQLLG